MEPPCSEFAKEEGPPAGTQGTSPESPIPTPVQTQEPRPLLERVSSGDSVDLWEGCVKGGRPRGPCGPTSPVVEGVTDAASDAGSHHVTADSYETSRDVFKSASSCPDLLVGGPLGALDAGQPPRYPGGSRYSADDLLRGTLTSVSSLDDPSTEKRVHGSPSALFYLSTGLRLAEPASDVSGRGVTSLSGIPHGPASCDWTVLL